MTHDDFVERHPFREHLVSEGLAGAVSELCQPGRPDHRYVYFDPAEVAWCDAHRKEIAERLQRALADGEPYWTFYGTETIGPGSPESCDYWFGLHLARHALREEEPGALLALPSSAFLHRFLGPFLDRFLSAAGTAVVVAAAPAAPPAALAPRPATELPAAAPRPDMASDDPELDDPLAPETRAFDRELGARLSAEPGLARRLEESLAGAVAAARIHHAGEPWHVHAHALVVSADDREHLAWACEGLLRVVEKVIDAYRRDAAVRAFFGFPRHLEELCLLEPGYRPHVGLGRLDSYWSGRRLRFLELNANGTAGLVLAQRLGELALTQPILGDTLRAHGAEPLPVLRRVRDALLSAWRQARAARGGPELPRRVAIVDWAGLPTATELDALAAAFRDEGLATEVVGPDSLSFDGRELHGPGGPIDLVYRRLTTLDLIEQHARLTALLDAARAGAVVVVGSFASDVAHSKRLFAFLTDQRWQRLFTPAERTLVQAHVPWTRVLEPGKTLFEGRRRSLPDLVLGERERFVLKPAEGYEGRGVLLGCETGADEWAREVRRRLGGGHVVQERVAAPVRRIWLPDGDGVVATPRWFHLGEYVVDGQFAGLLARASEELVLSVHSEERALPCLVLPRRGEEAAGGLGPASP
jgi:hypothetical protein